MDGDLCTSSLFMGLCMFMKICRIFYAVRVPYCNGRFKKLVDLIIRFICMITIIWSCLYTYQYLALTTLFSFFFFFFLRYSNRGLWNTTHHCWHSEYVERSRATVLSLAMLNDLISMSVTWPFLRNFEVKPISRISSSRCSTAVSSTLRSYL